MLYIVVSNVSTSLTNHPYILKFGTKLKLEWMGFIKKRAIRIKKGQFFKNGTNLELMSFDIF